MTNQPTTAYNFTLAIDSQADDHLALLLIGVPGNEDIKGRFVMFDEQAMNVVSTFGFGGMPYHQLMSDTDKYIGEMIEEYLEEATDENMSFEEVFGSATEHYDYIRESLKANLPEDFFEKLKPLVNVMDNLINEEDPNRVVALALQNLDVKYLGE